MRRFFIVLSVIVASTASAQTEVQDPCISSDAIADPENTIFLCNQVIAAQSDNPNALVPALHNRGIAHRQLGDIDQSIADFNAVLALDPTNTPTRRMLAWTYRQSGQEATAEALYSAILEQDDHWQGWLSRCAVRTDLKRYNAAIRDCSEVERRLSLDTSMSEEGRQGVMRDVWYFTAISLNELNRPGTAASVARQGLGQPDISGRLYFVTLVGLWNSNQLEQIDSVLTEGLVRYPDDAELLYFQSEWNKR
jgi:tetratricopeptide (TPR) repeat protein